MAAVTICSDFGAPKNKVWHCFPSFPIYFPWSDPGYWLEGVMLKLKLQYLVTWCEELTHWKRSWCCEKLKAGGKGDVREWDGWMASLTWWPWVCASSSSWWWTGKPGMLLSMGSQSVWVTELNQWYPRKDGVEGWQMVADMQWEIVKWQMDFEQRKSKIVNGWMNQYHNQKKYQMILMLEERCKCNYLQMMWLLIYKFWKLIVAKLNKIKYYLIFFDS